VEITQRFDRVVSTPPLYSGYHGSKSARRPTIRLFSVPPGWLLARTLSQVSAISIHIISNSLFTDHLVIQLCVIWYSVSVVKFIRFRNFWIDYQWGRRSLSFVFSAEVSISVSICNLKPVPKTRINVKNTCTWCCINTGWMRQSEVPLRITPAFTCTRTYNNRLY
jgi:hypothetical protein